MESQNPFSGHPILALSPNIPNDANASSAWEQIRIAEHELRKIDRALSLILARRAAITSRLNRCRMVIAPYKRLPAELIRKIILLCVPRVEAKKVVPSKQYYDSRLRITQICATWRKVAFDEPTLWNLNIYPCDELIDLTESWFRQSSCSRLGLTVQEEEGGSSGFEFERFFPVADKLISPYSRRLISLGMIVDRALLKLILSFPFDSLVEISLTLDYRDDVWKVSDLRFRHPIPSLRSVTLDVPRGIFDENFFLALPLSQLTNIKLGGIILAPVLPLILRHCHSLEKCTIACVYQAEFSPPPSLETTIPLQHLQGLNIMFGSYDAEQLLCSFKAPNLSSLVTDADFSSPRFRSFFQRISNLRSITIPGRGLRGSFIDENIISSNPHLVDFRTGAYPLQPSTLVRIGTGDFLPKVEHLEFQESNLQLALDMLNMRWAVGQTHPESISMIKRVVIRGHSGEGSFKNSFDVLRSHGMKISVAHS